MMENFTEGPWVAICPEQRLLVGESKEHDITQYEVMSVKTRGELTMGGATHYRKDVDCVDNISIAQAYWRDMSDEEAKANAALIAAAPEMYEMLKVAADELLFMIRKANSDLIQSVTSTTEMEPDYHDEQTVFEIMQLLKKARGEQ